MRSSAAMQNMQPSIRSCNINELSLEALVKRIMRLLFLLSALRTFRWAVTSAIGLANFYLLHFSFCHFSYLLNFSLIIIIIINRNSYNALWGQGATWWLSLRQYDNQQCKTSFHLVIICISNNRSGEVLGCVLVLMQKNCIEWWLRLTFVVLMYK